MIKLDRTALRKPSFDSFTLTSADLEIILFLLIDIACRKLRRSFEGMILNLTSKNKNTARLQLLSALRGATLFLGPIARADNLLIIARIYRCTYTSSNIVIVL